ncbi:16S rRNA (cytidine(1402)-2'-O)-methyltransferase [Chloroflexota bacterium]
MPTLYLVATPIGNLEDITFRALRILREVKIIAAEDTRRTKQLLVKYDIKVPVTSYHEHNKFTKLDYILSCLDMGDVALVSDAGMPGISDPGHELVVAANRHEIPVVPIPGPSVVITALAVSGLPTDQFLYLGFLPRKAGARQRLLKTVATQYGSIIILESPHRLLATLSDILLVLGDRKLAICRELTKIHEEIFRGTVGQAISHFTQPRGEFTLVIEGAGDRAKPQLTEDIKERLKSMRQSGLKAKEAVARVAEETGLAKKELYRNWLNLE